MIAVLAKHVFVNFQKLVRLLLVDVKLVDDIVIPHVVSVLDHKDHHVHNNLEEAGGVRVMLQIVHINIGLAPVNVGLTAGNIEVNRPIERHEDPPTEVDR